MITIRDVALKQFGLNSIATQTPLSELEQTLVPLYNFHRYQVEAAAKLVAGLVYDYSVKNSSAENNQQAVKIVSGDQQEAAINAIIATLDAKWLTLPERILQLIPPKAYGYQRTRESFSSNTSVAFDPVAAAQASAEASLSLLLNSARLTRLQQQHARDKAIPSVEHLIEQLIQQTIKKPAENGLT